jgi:hypothetical protein
VQRLEKKSHFIFDQYSAFLMSQFCSLSCSFKMSRLCWKSVQDARRDTVEWKNDSESENKATEEEEEG